MVGFATVKELVDLVLEVEQLLVEGKGDWRQGKGGGRTKR
jgi:hypothetical protein